MSTPRGEDKAQLDMLVYAPATELTGRMRAGELSVTEVLEAHITRIEQVNPRVNALVSMDLDRARAQARAADAQWSTSAELGPLYGLPVAHKDILDAAGFPTTRGSALFKHHVATADHLVVERMRKAGAVTLGKTNVPEFGLGSHTFNHVFGPTRNPFDLQRSAGGSSGGAAAALAAGMIALADGSDTGGSLRNPASFCNVVGLRPTPGRVPTWPERVVWRRLSVKGPMARSVADLTLLLSVLAEPDARNPLSLHASPFRYGAAMQDMDCRGLRIAWTPDLAGRIPVDVEVVDALTPAVHTFRELGCAVEESAPDLSGAFQAFEVLRAFQLDHELGPLMDEHRDDMKATAIWNIEYGRRLTTTDVARAEEIQSRVYQRMVEFFETYDFLVLPVCQVAPFDIGTEYPTAVAGRRMETYLDWMRLPSIISVTGHPALSVPAGFTPSGLPVGLQIVGAYAAEESLLRLGRAFEAVTTASRVRPEL